MRLRDILLRSIDLSLFEITVRLTFRGVDSTDPNLPRRKKSSVIFESGENKSSSTVFPQTRGLVWHAGWAFADPCDNDCQEQQRVPELRGRQTVEVGAKIKSEVLVATGRAKLWWWVVT